MIPHRFFRLVRFDLFHMFMCIFQCFILQQDFCCCFLSDTRQTRDIVRRISHQRFQINNLSRKKTVFFLHLSRMVIFNRGNTFHSLWNPDQNVIRCKLKQVTVPGYNCDFHSFCLAFPAKRSKNIIRLISLFCDNFDIHRREHFLDHRNLFTQLLRHWFSRSLILVIHFVPEGRRMKIKCHSEILGLLLLKNLEQNI